MKGRRVEGATWPGPMAGPPRLALLPCPLPSSLALLHLALLHLALALTFLDRSCSLALLPEPSSLPRSALTPAFPARPSSLPYSRARLVLLARSAHLARSLTHSCSRARRSCCRHGWRIRRSSRRRSRTVSRWTRSTAWTRPSARSCRRSASTCSSQVPSACLPPKTSASPGLTDRGPASHHL